MSIRIQRWVASPPDLVELDDGRCCGRKPMVYRRPETHLFCPRCDRRFDAHGQQVPNFGWRRNATNPSRFERTR